MRTTILRVDPNTPEPDSIAVAARTIRNGGLVAFPTETVYGLGANALDAQAVARIFEAKGRPPNNPLIVHVCNADAAEQIVTEWPEIADRLAMRFWPGPLTLILPRRDVIPDIVTAGGPTVAVRIPSHPVARALLTACGIPIAAPSANRSTQVSATRAEHVLRSLNGRIEMILDGGQTTGGLESTVLNLTTDPPALLRPGLISPGRIEALIGPITRPSLKTRTNSPLPSPGLMARHYAPDAPLELASGDGWERARELAVQGQKVGWLSFTAREEDVHPNVVAVGMPTDPQAYAMKLYATLHSLDELGVDRILVQYPPELDAWLAVRDRLRRAATNAGS